jgi:hypothetical protein
MKSILIVVCAVLLFGCSSASVEDVGSVEQASTAYLALNSAVALPQTGFCHPINFQGASAHAGSRIMTWGIPATGGWSLTQSGNGYAFPQDANQGIFKTNYECHEWSEITHKTTTPGVDVPKYLNWQETPDTTWVSGALAMSGWGSNSPCWLEGVAHMSATGEHAWMGMVGGTWTLNAEGYAALYAQARCAWLGRPIQPIQVMTATPGAPAYETFGPASGTCFVMEVLGSVDDGYAGFTKQTPWKLEATGSVTKVRGYCVPF